jgi:TIR domain/YEATS family
MTLSIAQNAAPKDKAHWSWSVWLEGPDDELDSVKEVIWKLHPSFARPIRRVDTRGNGFRLESSGWEEFEIQAELHRLNGQVDNLRHRIRFDRQNLDQGSRSEAIDNTDGSLTTPDIVHPLPTIFLSYSRQDAQLAGVLARTLKQRGINVLLDVDVPSGVDFRRWIEEAIEGSNAMVVLVSDKTFPDFSYTAYELGYATAAGVRVVVVTLAELPTDNPFARSLSTYQLIQAKPGPDDTAAYIGQRIIESLGGDGKHQAGSS